MLAFFLSAVTQDPGPAAQTPLSWWQLRFVQIVVFVTEQPATRVGEVHERHPIPSVFLLTNRVFATPFTLAAMLMVDKASCQSWFNLI